MSKVYSAFSGPYYHRGIASPHVLLPLLIMAMFVFGATYITWSVPETPHSSARLNEAINIRPDPGSNDKPLTSLLFHDKWTLISANWRKVRYLYDGRIRTLHHNTWEARELFLNVNLHVVAVDGLECKSIDPGRYVIELSKAERENPDLLRERVSYCAFIKKDIDTQSDARATASIRKSLSNYSRVFNNIRNTINIREGIIDGVQEDGRAISKEPKKVDDTSTWI